MSTPIDTDTTRAAYSVAEVAKALGVSENAVRYYVRTGAIPHHKLNTTIFIPAGWLDEMRDGSTSLPTRAKKQKAGAQ